MFEAIGEALRAIPAPTQQWADIIGHLAWPVSILLALWWFRGAVKEVLSRLAHDDIVAGNVQLRKPKRIEFKLGEVIHADANAPEDLDDSDIIEAIFEYIASDDRNLAALEQWISDNLDSQPEDVHFLTSDEYANDRIRAARDLIWEA